MEPPATMRRGPVGREVPRAGAVGAVVEDAGPDTVAGGQQVPVGVEAGIDGSPGAIALHRPPWMSRDVGHALVHDLQRESGLVVFVALVVDDGEPDDLVAGMAVVVQQALANGERLVGVVNVQLAFEVVAPVDDRDLEVTAEDQSAHVVEPPTTCASIQRSSSSQAPTWMVWVIMSG